MERDVTRGDLKEIVRDHQTDGHLNKVCKRTSMQNVRACGLWRDASGSAGARAKVAGLEGC